MVADDKRNFSEETVGSSSNTLHEPPVKKKKKKKKPVTLEKSVGDFGVAESNAEDRSSEQQSKPRKKKKPKPKSNQESPPPEESPASEDSDDSLPKKTKKKKRPPQPPPEPPVRKRDHRNRAPRKHHDDHYSDDDDDSYYDSRHSRSRHSQSHHSRSRPRGPRSPSPHDDMSDMGDDDPLDAYIHDDDSSTEGGPEPRFKYSTADLDEGGIRNSTCCLIAAGIFFLAIAIGVSIAMRKKLNSSKRMLFDSKQHLRGVQRPFEVSPNRHWLMSSEKEV